MELQDLIDLEARCALDERADPSALRARDRAAMARVAAPAKDRSALLSSWLAALRAAGEPSLGPRVVGGLRMLRFGLSVVGLLVGWSTAAVLLRYEGRDPEPINVATWLLVVVLLQLALLVLLLASVPTLRAFPDAPVLSEVNALLRGLAGLGERALEKADQHLSPERRESFRAARARLRTRGSMYRGVEQWVLLGLSQAFAIAFNVGLLLCALRLVVFSDLAFAWSTTLEMPAARFHGFVSLLARPFEWLVPDASPTLELVEKTRYWRGEFTDPAMSSRNAVDPTVAGHWWRFLLAVTLVYGLLPRVVILAVARWRRRRALRALPLDTPEIDRIVRRLTAPEVETRGAGTSSSPAPGVGDLGSRADLGVGGAVSVVLWKDLPLDEQVARGLVSAALRAEVRAVRSAGGLDYDADREACAALARDDARVIVLAEGFEAPDKSARAFLRDLRAALGPRRTILVGLVDVAGPRPHVAAAEDVGIWRDRLRLLDDPYLAVEPLDIA